jgi:hypothetical protein
MMGDPDVPFNTVNEVRMTAVLRMQPITGTVKHHLVRPARLSGALAWF